MVNYIRIRDETLKDVFTDHNKKTFTIESIVENILT